MYVYRMKCEIMQKNHPAPELRNHSKLAKSRVADSQFTEFSDCVCHIFDDLHHASHINSESYLIHPHHLITLTSQTIPTTQTTLTALLSKHLIDGP